jgi:hypothetical protein
MLDEIRIWNVARTSAEVGSSYITSVAPNSLGLIGYWNFNGTGQTISDMSSQANHGSLGRATAIGGDDPTRLDSTAPFTENCDGGSTNVAPVANDDAVGPVQAGSSISFSVTGNDLDADSNLNPASVLIESMPSSGTASVDSTGKINYISTGSSALTDTLAYSVKDTEGATSNIATVSITVTATDIVPANLAPVAQADTATAQSGGSVQIPILSNDTDSDGNLDKSSIFIVSGASNGNIDIDSITGQVTYTHDGSSMTSDSFVYTVTDNQGLASNEATVSLTINNTVSSSSCGKGMELDGIDDWVNIPNVTLASDFTVEGWVKLAPGIDNRDALFGQEGGGPDINFYAGKVRLYAYGDRVKANTAIAPNTWNHIAITRSSGSLTIYINGVQDATGRWTGALSVKAIGRGNRGYLKGMVDEVRIWNIARTGSEITTSYNTNVAVNSAGLIGSWSFNGIDQVVTDASSQVSHGSLGKNTTVGADDPIRASSLAPIVESCN